MWRPARWGFTTGTFAASTIALGAISVALLTSAACERTRRQAADDTPTPAATEVPSPCPAPPLEPGYLPEDVEETEEDPLFASPERTRTWEGDGILVQLLEGFAADHGDSPGLEATTVRSDETATIGPVDARDGEALVVDWDEDTACGHKQYAVATRGVSEDETLKIARSLEG